MMSSSSIGFAVFVTVMMFDRGTAEQSSKDLKEVAVQAFDPMVAFVCRLPAMHWTSDGWIPDETTGCIKDSDKILDYCRKIYPDLSIDAIAESTRPMRIRNWCESGPKRCNSHSHFVRPFRCLDNASAVPSSTSSLKTSTTDLVEPTEPVPDDTYVLFIRNAPQLNLSEHAYYVKAKTALHQRHHIKLEKMMEQWASMNRTAEKTWINDRENAEDLKKQITTRFQKLFEALTQEEKFDDRQLSELHQQRIQAELNRLKRDALDSYMKALRDDPVDPSVILKSLKHYIRMEERDSDHTVSRYLHIRRKDHHEAESIISYVLEHLNVIEKRIRQAFDMLDRIPKHKKFILRQIDPFLRQFETLEENIAIVRRATDDVSTAMNDVSSALNEASTASGDVSPQSVPEGHQFVESVNVTSGEGGLQELKVEEKKPERMSVEQEHRYSMKAVALTTVAMVAESTTPVSNSAKTTKAKGQNVPKKMAEVLRKVKLDHVAFMQKSEHHLNEVDLKQQKSYKEPGTFIATPIGMTVFSIGLVVLIAAALILLHRRARGFISTSIRNSRPQRNRFLQVTRKASAKKVDVSNGYENPTYRYLHSAAKD